MSFVNSNNANKRFRTLLEGSQVCGDDSEWRWRGLAGRPKTALSPHLSDYGTNQNRIKGGQGRPLAKSVRSALGVDGRTEEKSQPGQSQRFSTQEHFRYFISDLYSLVMHGLN